jgi:hypothetical protein
VHGAAFRVLASAGDCSDAPVTVDVYGWALPHWEDAQYVAGQWRRLGSAYGRGAASLALPAATEPYASVRIASHASDDQPVTLSVSR